MKAFSLIGVDGNVFNVIAYTQNAMKQAGYSRQERNEFFKLCTEQCENYDEVLVCCMEWVDKCNEVLGLEEFEDED